MLDTYNNKNIRCTSWLKEKGFSKPWLLALQDCLRSKHCTKKQGTTQTTRFWPPWGTRASFWAHSSSEQPVIKSFRRHRDRIISFEQTYAMSTHMVFSSPSHWRRSSSIRKMVMSFPLLASIGIAAASTHDDLTLPSSNNAKLKSEMVCIIWSHFDMTLSNLRSSIHMPMH